MEVLIPTIKLRLGIESLLKSSSLNYTKSDGSNPTALYLETPPEIPGGSPYVRFVNAVIRTLDAKNCKGWDAAVFIETMTAFPPGKGSYDWVDEIEYQMINVIAGEPYQLDLSPEYSIIGISHIESSYEDGLVKINTSKREEKEKYIVQKITEFQILLGQA